MKVPSDAQARLLGCVEGHEQRGEYVLAGKYPERKSRIELAIERDDYEHPGGVGYFVALDAEIPALAPADLEVVRPATYHACSHHGWIDDSHRVTVRSQCFAREYFGQPREFRLAQVNLTSDGQIALGLWRQRKAAKPQPLLTLTGRERDIMRIALDAERLGFVLAPMTDHARSDARRLARQRWAARGFIGTGVRSLQATPLSLGETHPELADTQLERAAEGLS